MVPATLKAASTSMIQRYFMTSSPFEPRGPLLFLFGWETMKVTPQVLCTLKRDVLVAIEASSLDALVQAAAAGKFTTSPRAG